jgi:hypothetical protein
MPDILSGPEILQFPPVSGAVGVDMGVYGETGAVGLMWSEDDQLIVHVRGTLQVFRHYIPP